MLRHTVLRSGDRSIMNRMAVAALLLQTADLFIHGAIWVGSIQLEDTISRVCTVLTPGSESGLTSYGKSMLNKL